MGFSRGRVAMSSSCSCAGGGCRNGDMIVIEARSRQLRTGGAHFAHCPILGPINCWQFTAPKAVSSRTSLMWYILVVCTSFWSRSSSIRSHVHCDALLFSLAS